MVRAVETSDRPGFHGSILRNKTTRVNIKVKSIYQKFISITSTRLTTNFQHVMINHKVLALGGLEC